MEHSSKRSSSDCIILKPPSASHCKPSRNVTKLRQQTGAAPLTVLYCPACIEPTLADEDRVELCKIHRWAVCLICPTCAESWTICAECRNQRKAMTTSGSIYMHNYKKHRGQSHSFTAPIDPLASPRIDSIADHDFSKSDMSADDDDAWNKLRSKALPGAPSFNFSCDHNRDYFQVESNHGLGRAYLVGQSQFKLGIVGPDLNCNEVDMHLSIACLVGSITSGQRDKLATVLRQVVAVTQQQCSDQRVTSKWTTQVPTTPAELRAKYVEGKYALLPNLPRPPVHIVGDHAYVSLKDCVADLLGHGLEVDSIERVGSDIKVTRISNSLRAQRILDNSQKAHGETDVLTLYITEWSDGFEPSLSIKGNRGSCWIKTVTISPPPNKLHSLSHTYPIALGHDGDNHEEVEEKFAAELLSFGCGESMDFYHGTLKRDVRVHLELFVSLQDQPERRSANYIMLGTSCYTARWGLALDFVAVASGIPACNNCLALMLRQTSTVGEIPTQCGQCVNWDTDVNNGLLDFSPPEHYPVEQVPTSGKLSPKRLTYDVMMAAVERAHSGVVSRGWSFNNMKSYLRVHGLNAEAISAISECAMKCRSYKSLLDAAEGGVVGPELAAMEEEREQRPELFRMWKFPSLWVRGVQLSQHIDVVMHLLFLGVIKTTIQKIQQWTKERGKHTAFLTYSKGIFESVQKLGLDWCRCVPYKTGKLGGWVSENYLGAARLMNWFYGSIDDIASDPVFVEPDRPMNRWTKPNNQGWLGSRGLDTTGNADQLRLRVLEYIQQPGGPPPEKGPQGGEVANVHAVVEALKAMVSRLMCRWVTESHVQDVDRHIKLFLNAFEVFDSAMRCAEDTPTWISSYNFICLTNLPSVLREFGPLRNLWEGAGQGEKILRLVKPTWIGLRKNWQMNMLDRLLRQTAMGRLQSKVEMKDDEMKWMTEDVNDESDDEEETEIKLSADIFRGNRLLRRYKNEADVRRHFELRHPLSIVALDGQQFCCVLRNNEAVRLHCMEFKGQTAGANYHLWQLDNNVEPNGDRHLQQITSTDQVTHFCILLPKLSMNGLPGVNEEPSFTLVDSEWCEIQPDKSIALPRIAGAYYDVV
jgi:hypothetical protein